MSLKPMLDDLSQAASNLDGTDLPLLASLQDTLSAARVEAEAQDENAASVVDQANDIIEQIILRELEDTQAAIAYIADTIDYLGNIIQAVENGSQDNQFDPPVYGNPSTQQDQSAQPFSPPEDIDPELVSAWVSQCEHTLPELEALIVSLDNQGNTDESLADVRRRVHTIKGECGILSLDDASTLCHEAESAIDRCLENSQPFPVDNLLHLVDWLKKYVHHYAQDPTRHHPAPEHTQLLQAFQNYSNDPTTTATSQTTIESSPVPNKSTSANPDDIVSFDAELLANENLDQFVDECHQYVDNAQAALLPLHDDPHAAEPINALIKAFHRVNGCAGFLDIAPVVQIANTCELLLNEAQTGALQLTREHLKLLHDSCDLLTALLDALAGKTDPPTNHELSHLCQLLTSTTNDSPIENEPPGISDLTPDDQPAQQPNAKCDPVPATFKATNTPADPAQVDSAAPATSTARHRANQTVKVNTTRMDGLVDMVGELVIAHQMVVQDESIRGLTGQRTQRNLTHVGKIIRDLQEVAMSLRMVTVKPTFQRMARLVRDLSVKSGKKINFVIEGEDTELDRNVVEEIADPLVHMIRNACDHGLEGTQERTAAGKREIGTLTLRAFHQGGSIVIEVEDDGRGLNRERILEKAIEQGLVPADKDVNEIPDDDVYNMVFMPGFTTASEVTDVSGRGVGMDVVRRNLEALRGKAEIRSTPSKGSTFVMRLPLTMAIIDGMVVRVGSQRYVVPTLAIEQSYRPTKDEIHTVVGRGEMARVRGSLLPIYRLNKVFGLSEGLDDLQEALLLVLEANNSRCSLVVDEILGQQQVVIKSLGQGINSIRGVSGGAILGDGRVALIVDVAGLVTEATKQQQAA